MPVEKPKYWQHVPGESWGFDPVILLRRPLNKSCTLTAKVVFLLIRILPKYILSADFKFWVNQKKVGLMDNTVSLSCLWTGCIRAWRRQSVINCLFSADCKRLPQSAICHVSNHPSRCSPLTPRETVRANSKAHDSLHLFVYIQTNGAVCSLMKTFNTDIIWLTFRGTKLFSQSDCHCESWRCT